jgi:hypothetical protein
LLAEGIASLFKNCPEYCYKGYYAIFHKGVQQFAVNAASSQDVNAAFDRLKALKLKLALIDCGL